jgi:hypothetical protein
MGRGRLEGSGCMCVERRRFLHFDSCKKILGIRNTFSLDGRFWPFWCKIFHLLLILFNDTVVNMVAVSLFFLDNSKGVRRYMGLKKR